MSLNHFFHTISHQTSRAGSRDQFSYGEIGALYLGGVENRTFSTSKERQKTTVLDSKQTATHKTLSKFIYSYGFKASHKSIKTPELHFVEIGTAPFCDE